jgi:RNA-directed DNA polymerase
MSLRSKRPQTSRQLELSFDRRGEAPKEERSEEERMATSGTDRSGTSALMERVLSRPNLQAALKRVKQNKGSAGVDGMTVGELGEHLRGHWYELREQLLTGAYRPAAVKQQLIPKSGGGIRKLGIPTALDRFIQQALLQVLQPMFDPGFSQHSHGFRPGRSAHDAIVEAREYVKTGRKWVVDVDLAEFFDRVNHDVLMGKLAKRIGDRCALGLIRQYLNAGILANGLVVERREGTPQGGPLSPLLANVLLDEVDKELEKRGHAFVRYADDCNVYVQSRRAGERVMQLLRRLYAKLRLTVNEAKSTVDLVWNRKLLGYSFWEARDGAVRLRVSDKAIVALKERVRHNTRGTVGRSMARVIAELRSYLPGWKAYFNLADLRRIFVDLDKWIRRRLRGLHLKQWKTGPRAYRALRALGCPELVATMAAGHDGRWWRYAACAMHNALPTRYFDELGLPRLAA